MESPLPLTKKERKELRKRRKLEERQRVQRSQTGRKLVRSILIFIPAAGLVGLFIWWAVNQQPVAEGDIIARGGLHWHPKLSIVINGGAEAIPANIGIGAVHNPIHTHDPDNVIHLEMSGRVTKNDIRLREFFKVWRRQFNSDCIFEYCNGPDGSVTMTVNGQNNAEYEQYVMQDSDTIEINYDRK